MEELNNINLHRETFKDIDADVLADFKTNKIYIKSIDGSHKHITRNMDEYDNFEGDLRDYILHVRRAA